MFEAKETRLLAKVLATGRSPQHGCVRCYLSPCDVAKWRWWWFAAAVVVYRGLRLTDRLHPPPTQGMARQESPRCLIRLNVDALQQQHISWNLG